MVHPGPIRVALDAHAVGRRKTGNETYIVNLVDALSRRSDVSPIAYLDDGVHWPGAESARPQIRRLRFGLPQLRIPLELPYRARKDHAQLLHVQYVVPPISSVPVVAAIHDVSFEDVAGLFSTATRFRLRLTIRASARRAVRVLALSEFTRSRIIHHYGLDPAKVKVAYAGVGPQWRRLDPRDVSARLAESDLPERFVLVVGNLHPRKNVPRLVRVVAKARQRGAPGLGLVIAGQAQWRSDDVDREIERAHGSDWAVRLGYVNQEMLVALYNAATVVAYPSQYEGFGLPVVEAMACGAVVVASDTTSIPEVAGDAAILVDPMSDDAVLDGIERAIGDDELRSALRVAGLERASRFTWEASAEATVAAYHEALRDS